MNSPSPAPTTEMVQTSPGELSHPRAARMPAVLSALLLFALAATAGLHAAVPRDLAVDLQATVSDTSPRIVLSWSQRLQSNISSQTISRRLKGETTWVQLATLATTQTSYSDTTALAGVEYEYRMLRSLSGVSPYSAIGFIAGGVKIPETGSRGKLLLVVDDTMVASLATEIDQLKTDLTADGWIVQQITAPRSGTAASTKALIKAAYDADPGNVKSVYLLGHVPVPYSGNIGPDGHGDHFGAWPADGYYSDMDGTWTDTSVNVTSASDPRNRNIPGDGKFDQDSYPSSMELQVGRVDLSNLTYAPNSGVSETSLLRRYLKKAHDFRHKLGAYAAIPRRSLIRDGFGYFNGEAFAAASWAGAFTCVDHSAVDEAPAQQWFLPAYAGGQDYLWGEGNGSGSFLSASDFGTAAEFGNKPSRVVFTSAFGSYFGDWDSNNNLMRSILAGNAAGDSLGLVCYWSGRPYWYAHSLGMGETVGYMNRASIQAAANGYTGPGGYSQVHMGLMGDPALRIHAVEPPRKLAGSSSSGAINLTWAASTEPGLQGYHVYRAASAAGPFTKLTASPLAGTSYTDSAVTSGSTYTYLVRTLKLESVPSGSYYNQSVGSTITLAANASGSAAPSNPSELTIGSQVSSASAVLSWQDNSSNETGFRIERKTNAGGTFATIATAAANATTYTDPGPFTSGNVYYYRVFATGASGDSVASNIASFEANPGYIAFDTTPTMKVSKTVGTAQIPVKRFGGGRGAATVQFTTVNSSAIAGTHYTASSGTLSWADGETGVKYISVAGLNTVTPQQARQFRIALSNPTGGTSFGQISNIAVLIEDPTATLPSPWSQTIINESIPDSSPAVQAEGGFGSTTVGPGYGLAAGNSFEVGQFIYQAKTGDGVLTAYVPTSTPVQTEARFAVMVRSTVPYGGAIMAATVTSDNNPAFGSQFIYRPTQSAGSTALGGPNTQSTPRWIRITRTGNTFTSESSANGTSWTVLGSVTIPSFPTTAQWGLFHYSANTAYWLDYSGDFQLGTFQNVAFSDPPAPSSPPTGLTAVASAPTTVGLTWTAAPYATGYRIERRSDSGAVDVFTTTNATLSDTGLVADTAYQYRILAYSSGSETAWSAPVGVTTPPGYITTNIAAEADATVGYNSADTPLGTGSLLTVEGSSVTNSLDLVSKTWLRFNLSGLPDLLTATLKLTVVQARIPSSYFYGILHILAQETSDTWSESAITWNNAPQNDTTTKRVLDPFMEEGARMLVAASAPAPGSIVTMVAEAGDINYSKGANGKITFAVTPYYWANSKAIDFASRENGSLSGPMLEVTYLNPNPSRPGFLSVTSGSGSSLVITWNDNSSNETGFRLERRAANGEWVVLQTLAANVSSYTDSSALPGVIYEYRIRATGTTGNSSITSAASGLSHTSLADVSGPVSSPDAVAFDLNASASGNSYVPTGFTYYPPAKNFVTAQTFTYPAESTFLGWIGMKFTVGSSPIILQSLGRWVVSGNTGTHAVKLVNGSGVDIPGASVSVATAGAPVGFKYAALASPVTLTANTTYYLVSQEVNGTDTWYPGYNSVTFDSSVAVVNDAVYNNSGTNYVGGFGQNRCFGPLNFQYSTSPVAFTTGHSMTLLRNDYTGWLGMKITVGAADLLLSQLGRWVAPGNTGTHAVKLVNAATGADLATASVATSGATVGAFKYTALGSPVTLAANSSYYLLSQETSGGDQWYDFTTVAAGSATGYQAWLLANGLPMDESGDGSATATPAGDGLPNLIKYSLGLTPEVSGDGGRLAYGEANASGNDYLTLTYTRPEPAPSGISYAVEACSDLAGWTSAGLVEVSNTVNSGLRTITVRDSAPMSGNAKRFMHLKVTQP